MTFLYFVVHISLDMSHFFFRSYFIRRMTFVYLDQKGHFTKPYIYRFSSFYFIVVNTNLHFTGVFCFRPLIVVGLDVRLRPFVNKTLHSLEVMTFGRWTRWPGTEDIFMKTVLATVDVFRAPPPERAHAPLICRVVRACVRAWRAWRAWRGRWAWIPGRGTPLRSIFTPNLRPFHAELDRECPDCVASRDLIFNRGAFNAGCRATRG